MNGFEDHLKLLQPAPASEELRKRVAHPPGMTRRGHPFRFLPLGMAAAGMIAITIYAVVVGPTRQGANPAGPEEAFRRIEDTLLKTQTIRVQFKREGSFKEPSGKSERVVDSGTILLKEGDKLRFEFIEKVQTDRANSLEVEYLIVSNGTSLKAMQKTKDGFKPFQAWGGDVNRLKQKFSVALARSSISVPGNIMYFGFEEFEKQHSISDLKKGDDDGDAKTLSYTDGGYSVRLWYDPKTWTPLKRVFVAGDFATFTETYETCVLGEDIPEERFTLPAEK